MEPSVVAIGNFDGVHRGHRRVLAHALGDGALPLHVLTFWPHPVSLLRPDRAPLLLTDLTTRIDLLRGAGAHEVRVVQFTAAVAALDPEEFVTRYVLPLTPRSVVVGENFRFGRGARGDVATLAELGRRHGFATDPVALEVVDDDVTCSTLIRRQLAAGDVEGAQQHLGRPFSFRGVVVVGDQRGRDLGYPTANLRVDAAMAVPSDGVYAGWLREGEGPRLPAAISVGSNPTFDGVERRVETYVLDRDDLELYGREVVVEFAARLRGQVRFAGVEALVAQMAADVDLARQVLAGR